MGRRLTWACVLIVDPTLSDRARITLIRMATAVLDKPSGEQAAAEYWRGWEWLALPWDDGERTTAALKSIVMRALAELVAKGYVKTTVDAHHGERQRYVITVPL